MKPILAILVIGLAASTALAEEREAPAVGAGAFTIHDAINQTITSHPGVGEASANRRATEAEMRQVQGTLLPQIRLEARAGPERWDQQLTPPAGSGTWHTGQTASLVGRQLLFDGFATINEIWRQAARVDAAAFRVKERTELLALDGAESYIDVVRYLRLVALAEQNLANHRRILENVEGRFAGGRAGDGDRQQARERVEAAAAILAQFRQNLDEARGRFRRAVGIEPHNLRFPGRLHGLPATKDDSLAVALRYNPTVRAAGADVEAARYGYRSTEGAFFPTVAAEARALYGKNSDQVLGERDEQSVKVVATWDLFRGFQDSWRRVEAGERMIQQTMAHARLQRDTLESIDRAWAARTLTADRIAALLRQVVAARKTIEAYTREYELGQRTLIDLLDAQNGLFNGQVSLVSTRSVAVFADYQLLAAMGQLIEFLKTPAPLDAEPLAVKPFAIFPMKLPPLSMLLREPQTGPEPLNVVVPNLESTQLDVPPFDPWVVYGQNDRVPAYVKLAYAAGARTPGGSTPPAEVLSFSDRWTQWVDAFEGTVSRRWPGGVGAEARPAFRDGPGYATALSFAEDVMSVPFGLAGTAAENRGSRSAAGR